MSATIKTPLFTALRYAKDQLIRTPGTWIALLVFLLIPVLGWIFLAGYLIRVLRGGEAKLNAWKDLFVSGISAWGIILAYMCIPIVILFLFRDVHTVAALIQNFFVMTPGEVLAALPEFLGTYVFYLCLAAVFALRMTLGLIQYARTGEFLYAFVLNEMYEAVEQMGGWIVYALVWLCVAIPLLVITFGLLKIPIAGWIVLLILMPFLLVVAGKFLTTLLPAQDTSTPSSPE
ncbi:MAG: DUF4013 domain-containing protein [Methanocorpusculum sp.]|nr:DUF4013 domain-containing protein [Methanocorpusculum sp.]MDE2525406.1 DUF4013 domain-containing protein [Methanocorpusculum sp.]